MEGLNRAAAKIIRNILYINIASITPGGNPGIHRFTALLTNNLIIIGFPGSLTNIRKISETIPKFS